MYELSFYGRDKPIVKCNDSIWRPLDIEDSNILTKIVNNNYLKQNHPQISQVAYICNVECLVKYYTKPDVTVTAQCYLLSRNLSKRDKLVVKRSIAIYDYVPTELYIPGILFNGRGIWMYSHYSILCQHSYAARAYSRNKNFKFTSRKFNDKGILV